MEDALRCPVPPAIRRVVENLAGQITRSHLFLGVTFDGQMLCCGEVTPGVDQAAILRMIEKLYDQLDED